MQIERSSHYPCLASPPLLTCPPALKAPTNFTLSGETDSSPPAAVTVIDAPLTTPVGAVFLVGGRRDVRRGRGVRSKEASLRHDDGSGEMDS